MEKIDENQKLAEDKDSPDAIAAEVANEATAAISLGQEHPRPAAHGKSSGGSPKRAEAAGS